jgi:L-threonylcarbamoyladenylate synthase
LPDLKFQSKFRREIDVAARQLQSGGVIAFPTDTLYGLGADLFDESALERIFAIKGRPADLPLPALLASREQLEMVTDEFPAVATKLADRFWPGSLTLVVRKGKRVPDLATGGGSTIAVRIPNHRVPLALASKLAGPITGTSANLSGGPDLESIEELERELGSRLEGIIRCGPPPMGIPSTVVDVTSNEARVLREGAIPAQEILEAV